jgi:hypothetical protein
MPGFTDGFLQRMSEITPKPLEWIWERFIPLGNLSVLTGDSETAKSQVAVSIAAKVTKGLRPPSILSAKCEPASPGPFRPMSVLFVSMEDVVSQRFQPQLIAEGADLSKVFYLRESSASDDDAQTMTPDSPNSVSKRTRKRPAQEVQIHRELSRLAATLSQLKQEGQEVGFVVIDPLDWYLHPAKTRAYRENMIFQLGQLAQSSGATILLVATTSNEDRRTRKSKLDQELMQSPRAVLAITRSLEDPNQQLITSVKENYCKRGPGEWISIVNGVVQWN